jgi:hypothetical protein
MLYQIKTYIPEYLWKVPRISRIKISRIVIQVHCGSGPKIQNNLLWKNYTYSNNASDIINCLYRRCTWTRKNERDVQENNAYWND